MAALFTALITLGICIDAGAADAIIRRDKALEDVALEFESPGRMMKQREIKGAAVSRHVSMAETEGIAVCDDDFTLGQNDTNDCKDSGIPSKHVIIETGVLCWEAATQHGATVYDPDKVIDRFHKDAYPNGCFMTTCAHGAGICYFFNPIGDKPTTPAGTPVCKRAKYLNGTANTNGLGSDCPDGYEVIMDEDVCKQARCLGDSLGDPFRRDFLLNNSKHEEFPEGCFIHADDDKVYFNPVIQGYSKPAAPVGTPLCRVKEVVRCKGAMCAPRNATAADLLGQNNGPDSEDATTAAPATTAAATTAAPATTAAATTF